MNQVPKFVERMKRKGRAVPSGCSAPSARAGRYYTAGRWTSRITARTTDAARRTTTSTARFRRAARTTRAERNLRDGARLTRSPSAEGRCRRPPIGRTSEAIWGVLLAEGTRARAVALCARRALQDDRCRSRTWPTSRAALGEVVPDVAAHRVAQGGDLPMSSTWRRLISWMPRRV